MKLGESLGRRRKKRGGRGSSRSGGGSGRKGRTWSGAFSLFWKALVLALIGWGGGYVVATRIVFPAPPPPSNLFTMPDLRGLQLQAARARITGLGMKLSGVDSIRHPTVASGLVFGQSPLPGQLAMPSTPVRVTLSMGPQLRSIPDVRDLNVSRARVVLETSGFVVTTDSAQSDVPRGRVVDVDPPPDSVVPLPTTVKLTVSTGPPLVAMPMVLGMTEADARTKLDSLGLVVSNVKEVFRFGRDQGIVVEQQPAAQTELQPGAAVQLSVGRKGS